MRTTIWTSCPTQTARGAGAASRCRETIDEAILTYKREVEKMNEKVEKLERNYM